MFDDGIRDTVVVYSAGDTITYQRLADLVEERVAGLVAERPVTRELWTLGYLRRELQHDPENVLLRYRVVFAEGRGVRWKMADTINHQWDMQLEDVETYASRTP